MVSIIPVHLLEEFDKFFYGKKEGTGLIRILQVVTDMRPGGLETMLMNYYRYIDKSIIQFDFLVHRTKRGTFDDEIESMGGKIYRLPKLNPFSKHYKRALGNFFDEHPEYQIIHVHQDCLSSVILKVAKKHGIEVRIAHSHSSSQNKDLKYPIKLFYKRLIPIYATDLFACSDEAGKWMFNGAPFTVLNNAIDAKKYIYDEDKRNQMRTKLGIEPSEVVLGHVGRFSPPKNHDYLIDIFYEFQKTHHAKLLLVGDGKLRERIVEKVKKLGIEDKVIFTGIRSDVEDLMQAMDVFVFPSLYEGLGIVDIEAQANGLPCLISDKVPIECKKTKFVYQLELGKGAVNWANAIESLTKVNRENTYDDICLAGFDINQNVKLLESFYLNVLNK